MLTNQNLKTEEDRENRKFDTTIKRRGIFNHD